MTQTVYCDHFSFDGVNAINKQESIPGCVPPAFVVGGLPPRPDGTPPDGTPLDPGWNPPGQANTSENITFPQLRLRAVKQRRNSGISLKIARSVMNLM